MPGLPVLSEATMFRLQNLAELKPSASTDSQYSQDI